MEQRKVVVPIHLKYFRNEDMDVLAVHSEELGLTGYGCTEEEARESFKRVFSAFIQVSRSKGFLENMLNRIGVDWHWADEYEKPYEDVSERFPANSGGSFVAVNSPSKQAMDTMAA